MELAAVRILLSENDFPAVDKEIWGNEIKIGNIKITHPFPPSSRTLRSEGRSACVARLVSRAQGWPRRPREGQSGTRGRGVRATLEEALQCVSLLSMNHTRVPQRVPQNPGRGEESFPFFLLPRGRTGSGADLPSEARPVWTELPCWGHCRRRSPRTQGRPELPGRWQYRGAGEGGRGWEEDSGSPATGVADGLNDTGSS